MISLLLTGFVTVLTFVPDASPTLALTALEIRLLDELGKDKGPQCPPRRSTARASDTPPSNIVIRRRLSRLTDVDLGFMIGAKLVGN